jgi:hypothetical protein
MMRRDSATVNEMEFRMFRACERLSPQSPDETIKRFLQSDFCLEIPLMALRSLLPTKERISVIIFHARASRFLQRARERDDRYFYSQQFSQPFH